MSYLRSTYKSDIEPILKDWLTNSGSGKNVTNLPLSLANRAQENLWAKKPWSFLTQRVSVTLTAGAYIFPADFGRIIDMWADLNGQGVPTYWFYESDKYESGYRMADGFTKAGGHAWTINFHYAQQSNVYLRYQKILDNFTGSVTDEYSFFPANLMLLECQKINLVDKGNTKEFQLISAMFDEVYHDFCNSVQWVNYDPKAYLNDRFGYEVFTDNYSLSGGNSRPYSELPEAYIL